MKRRSFFSYLAICLLLAGCCEESDEINSAIDSLNIPSTISYSKLREIAQNPYYRKINKYKVSSEILPIDTNFDYLNFANSELGISTINRKKVLQNIYTGDEICSNIDSSKLEYEGTFSSFGGVCYSLSVPLAVYMEKGNDSSYALKIVNYKGDSLVSESFNIPSSYGYLYLGFSQTNIRADTYSKFTLRSTFDSNYFYYYFKYPNYSNEEKYLPLQINEDDYNMALISENSSTNNPTQYEPKEYKDNLTPLYNSNGEISSYYFLDSYTYYLYDSNKHYLNSVNINSYGFGSYSASVVLESKICFFKNEEYYKDQFDKGSKQKYKCKALFIDLISGEITYDNDFKYYISSARSVSRENKYLYSYLKYCDLNENGEINELVKCVILRNDVKFDDAFAYDGFTSDIYLLSDSAVLAKFDSHYYIVTEEERIMLNNITDINFYENGYMTYLNQNSKYYKCKTNDFINNYNKFENSFYYVSFDEFDGSCIECKIDSDKYFCDGLTLDSKYISYVKYGINVTQNALYIRNKKLIDFGENKLISLSSTNGYDNTIYTLKLSDDLNDKFISFAYTCNLEK